MNAGAWQGGGDGGREGETIQNPQPRGSMGVVGFPGGESGPKTTPGGVGMTLPT